MPIGEARFIKNEMRIRNLRLTKEVLETRRSMIRWLALSIGMINPGETRQSSIAVLDAMVYFQFKLKKDPRVEEIEKYIERNWGKMNEKTLRYHLLRMKNMGILEHTKGRHSFTWSETGEKYDEEEWLNSYFNRMTNPIKVNLTRIINELKQR